MKVVRHGSAWNLCLLAAMAAATVQPAFAVESKAPTLDNFDKVGPHIYRGAVPDTNALPELKKLGIATIVDLRMRHDADEELAAKKLGIDWVHLPMGYWAPSDKQVKRIMEVLSETSRGDIFIHCRQGADRTGTIVAIYRILVQDWSFDRAYKEMRAHHFNPVWFALKERVETYREQRDPKDVKLAGAADEDTGNKPSESAPAEPID